MAEFSGRLRMPNEVDDPGLPIVADITDGTVGLRAESGDLGRWAREHVIIVAQDDGFHFRADGEEVILTIDDDAAFAVAAGLTNAPPLLRRRMAELLRHED